MLDLLKLQKVDGSKHNLKSASSTALESEKFKFECENKWEQLQGSLRELFPWFNRMKLR